jgi:protein-S-isoprenylcysteine O-methyltransferase Ste14
MKRERVFYLLVRVAGFGGVLVGFRWSLSAADEGTWTWPALTGCAAAAAPLAFLGRRLLEKWPEGEAARYIALGMHYLVMLLLGMPVLGALRSQTRGADWPIAVNPWVANAMLVVSGTAVVLSMIDLAHGSAGDAEGVVSSRRLAVNRMYAWTRNPMVLSFIALLVSLGVWVRSGLFVAWSLCVVAPAWLTVVKVFEEYELGLRFGEEYERYRARTPFLAPRRPRGGG